MSEPYTVLAWVLTSRISHAVCLSPDTTPRTSLGSLSLCALRPLAVLILAIMRRDRSSR